MPDEVVKVPCKICGKKFEKVGFHVRKKHSMSMADYRNLPATSQERMPTTLEAPLMPTGTRELAMPGETIVTVEVGASSDKQKPCPWYKKLLFGLV
jgi:hypothetical protein